MVVAVTVTVSGRALSVSAAVHSSLTHIITNHFDRTNAEPPPPPPPVVTFCPFVRPLVVILSDRPNKRVKVLYLFIHLLLVSISVSFFGTRCQLRIFKSAAAHNDPHLLVAGAAVRRSLLGSIHLVLCTAVHLPYHLSKAYQVRAE